MGSSEKLSRVDHAPSIHQLVTMCVMRQLGIQLGSPSFIRVFGGPDCQIDFPNWKLAGDLSFLCSGVGTSLISKKDRKEEKLGRLKETSRVLALFS